MSDGVPFGSYRLQRRLARGGMAEVFLAKLVGVEGFERRVAIKRILPHLSESEEFRVMFLDEARLAAQLTHPNIVHIYDFGKVDDYYFIAMEYVDGIDIGRILKQGKARPVPFEYAARICADVCAGLNYAHNVTDPNGQPLNLVHRDVSPQNVLVTYDGVVKIVDFGIAKAAWSAGRTRPGVVKGKFAYMSPEQVEGRTLDGRSDVFSVGICLYELVTGAPLFRRDEVNASMREIRDGKPITPEKLRPDVPDPLVSIMRKALQTSREQRYPSAAAMQMDLERYLKNTDVLGTAQQLGEWIRREHPRPPDEEASGRVPAIRGGTQVQKEGTEKQAQGTQKQAQGTQVQRPPGELEATRRDPTPPPGALTDPLVDEDQPTAPDEEAPTREVSAPRQPTPEFDAPRSGTAVVRPLEPSGRRAAIAAGGAALGVSLIALLLFRPWSSAEPVIVSMPASAPKVTQLAPPPAEIPAPAAPPVAAPPVAAPPAAAPPSTVPVATVTPKAQPAVQPALDIVSRPPGARVTIDGRAVSPATPVRGQRLQPGLHRVVVERRGYALRELSVQLGDGEHRTLDVELRPAGRKLASARPTGTLTVKTVPWAKVFEGARLVGTTPMANVPLAEGTHVLTFVNPELPPVRKTVQVKAGEEARLSIDLKGGK